MPLKIYLDSMEIDELKDRHNKLKGIQEVISVYHMALTNREHGGIAQEKCISKIEAILDMYWSNKSCG